MVMVSYGNRATKILGDSVQANPNASMTSGSVSGSDSDSVSFRKSLMTDGNK